MTLKRGSWNIYTITYNTVCFSTRVKDSVVVNNGYFFVKTKLAEISIFKSPAQFVAHVLMF